MTAPQIPGQRRPADDVAPISAVPHPGDTAGPPEWPPLGWYMPTYRPVDIVAPARRVLSGRGQAAIVVGVATAMVAAAVVALAFVAGVYTPPTHRPAAPAAAGLAPHPPAPPATSPAGPATATRWVGGPAAHTPPVGMTGTPPRPEPAPPPARALPAPPAGPPQATDWWADVAAMVDGLHGDVAAILNAVVAGRLVDLPAPCAAVTARVDTARGYGPAPDPQMQAAWAAALDAYRQGGVDCRDGATRGDIRLLGRSVDELAAGAVQMTAMTTRLRQLNGPRP